MNKPSPGPWVVTKPSNGSGMPVEDWSINAIIDGQDVPIIAMQYDNGADAYLAAAAPEMYEALNMMLEFMRMQHAPESAPQMQMMIKALAKANGK